MILIIHNRHLTVFHGLHAQYLGEKRAQIQIYDNRAGYLPVLGIVQNIRINRFRIIIFCITSVLQRPPEQVSGIIAVIVIQNLNDPLI